MKVEFLENGSDDGPLIRIHGQEPEVCQQLKRAFEQLAQGKVDKVALTELPGVESLDDCCVVAEAGKRDQGVIRNGGNLFSWVLTPATWDNVAGLMEPFCCIHAGGYQWLDQVPASEVRVLVSASGSL